MCFKVFIYPSGTYDVVYKGVRVFGKKGDDSFSYFLQIIRESKGVTSFELKMEVLLKYFDDSIKNFLEESKFGISFFGKPKNADLFDEAGDIIFRGEGGMMKYFLDIRKTKGTEVWNIWKKQFWQALNDVKADSFDEAADYLLSLGFDVQKSDFGMSPDFRLSSKDFVYQSSTGKTFLHRKIKMTGSRELDYKAAIEVYAQDGLDPSDLAGFTWHHLDDFDPETGTCTMQLVKFVFHDSIEHTGAVKMWELFYGGGVGKQVMKYAN